MPDIALTKTPHPNTLVKAAEICTSIDKPLCFDYFPQSCMKQCKIIRHEDQKVLWKSDDEYTSPLRAMYKIDNTESDYPDYILETQNSVYIVSGLMLL